MFNDLNTAQYGLVTPGGVYFLSIENYEAYLEFMALYHEDSDVQEALQENYDNNIDKASNSAQSINAFMRLLRDYDTGLRVMEMDVDKGTYNGVVPNDNQNGSYSTKRCSGTSN